MTEQFGLKETTIQSLQKVLEKYPQVDKATLYGSRAMGRYKIGSDIDLTLHGGQSLNFQCFSKLWMISTSCSFPTQLISPFTILSTTMNSLTTSTVSESFSMKGIHNKRGLEARPLRNLTAE